MTFEVDGRRFQIEFEYPTPLMTVARLVEFNVDGGVVAIDEQEVVRYYKDQPNKDVARKNALRMLMDSLGWSREWRKAAWDVYLHRSPKNRYSYRFKEMSA